MGKKRVYELAQELKLNSKDLIKTIHKLGIPVANHMSALDDHDVERIYQYYTPPEEKKIIEQRIQPTIIRRRVKRLVPETEAVEVQPQKAEVEAKAPTEQPKIHLEKVEAAAEVAPPEPQEARERTEEVAASVGEIELRKEDAEEAGDELLPGEQPEEHEQVESKAEEEKPEAAMTAEEVSEEGAKDRLYIVEGGRETVEQREGADRDEGIPPANLRAAAEAKKKPFKKKKLKPREEPARIISRPEQPILSPQSIHPVQPIRPEQVIHPEQATTEPLDGHEKKKIIRPKKKWVLVTEEEEPAEKTARKPGKKPHQVLRERPEVALKHERRVVFGKRAAEPTLKKPEVTVPKAIKRKIKVAELISVSDLAKKMGVKATEIIKKLWGLGVMATINQSIDVDTAQLVADEFGYEVEKITFEAEEVLTREVDDISTLKPRPPVVTVMGHVDHGKTKLLDAIRQTDVVASEAGGITQHIGAYHVRLKSGEIIFIDTPGHEAFTAMRARGSHVTDVVILVVAASEGVKEQTVEAINHAKAAGVPIIVAVNKIDLPEANPERVKRELSEYGLVPEEWGGDTICVEISAKQKTNIDKLLEMILLQAEVLELKANPDKLARGTIIETRLDKGQGPVATVLIQEGTLTVGEPFVSGQVFGKVRAMLDDRGGKIKKAGPSYPVEVVGFSGLPEAGDQFIVVSDERKARMAVEHRLDKTRQREPGVVGKITLETLYNKIKEGEFKELKTIIKADVQGSIEALKKAITDINTKGEIKVNIIHTAVGAISESDVMLASASNAIIIGFNVGPDSKSQALASTEHVDIRTYTIIYEAIDDVKKAMEGLLAPIQKERILGRAGVIQLFQVSKVGTIAGSKVVEGKIPRGANARVIRNGEVIHEGKINTLKRFKEDVKEALTGYECGIRVENFNDIQLNDIIEAFEVEEIAQKLD